MVVNMDVLNCLKMNERAWMASIKGKQSNNEMLKGNNDWETSRMTKLCRSAASLSLNI